MFDTTNIMVFQTNSSHLCYFLDNISAGSSRSHSGILPSLTGEVAEWSNAAVLKTVDSKGSGGSNPSLSAIHPAIGAASTVLNITGV